MPSITLRAHFNGEQVVLDEPFELEPNVKLLITVLPLEENNERDDWITLSAKRLETACGDDEPEYTISNVKKANPEYDGR